MRNKIIYKVSCCSSVNHFIKDKIYNCQEVPVYQELFDRIVTEYRIYINSPFEQGSATLFRGEFNRYFKKLTELRKEKLQQLICQEDCTL